MPRKTTYTPAQKRKIAKGLCVVKFCSNAHCARKGYRCHKCYRKLEMQRNPFYCMYSNLKVNARRRKKPFNLSYKDFKNWCQATGYHKLCRQEPGMWHIDRINRNDIRGYHIKNIQLMKASENMRKWHAYESRGLTPPPGEFEAINLNAAENFTDQPQLANVPF